MRPKLATELGRLSWDASQVGTTKLRCIPSWGSTELVCPKLGYNVGMSAPDWNSNELGFELSRVPSCDDWVGIRKQ